MQQGSAAQEGGTVLSVLGLGCPSSPACPGSSGTRTWAAEVQEAALAFSTFY